VNSLICREPTKMRRVLADPPDFPVSRSKPPTSFAIAAAYQAEELISDAIDSLPSQTLPPTRAGSTSPGWSARFESLPSPFADFRVPSRLALLNQTSASLLINLT
jgi:hypothetical protein